MTRRLPCPLCGQQECGLHDDVLAFARVLDRCALFGAALLVGIIVATIGFAAW